MGAQASPLSGAHTRLQDPLLVMAPRVVHFVFASLALILLGCGDSCEEDTIDKLAAVGANADQCVENKNKREVFNAQAQKCAGNQWYPAAKSAQEQKTNQVCCLVLDNLVQSEMTKARTCKDALSPPSPSAVCNCYQTAYTNAAAKAGDCPSSAIGLKPITDEIESLSSTGCTK